MILPLQNDPSQARENLSLFRLNSRSFMPLRASFIISACGRPWTGSVESMAFVMCDHTNDPTWLFTSFLRISATRLKTTALGHFIRARYAAIRISTSRLNSPQMSKSWLVIYSLQGKRRRASRAAMLMLTGTSGVMAHFRRTFSAATGRPAFPMAFSLIIMFSKSSGVFPLHLAPKPDRRNCSALAMGFSSS